MIKVSKGEVRERMVDTSKGDNKCMPLKAFLLFNRNDQSFKQRLSAINGVANKELS